MPSFLLVFRWVVFFGIVGGVLRNLPGALAGAAFAIVLAAGLRVFAERILAWLLRAQTRTPAGWRHSFDRAAGEASGVELRMLPDPRPWILAVPSWKLGRGTLFISQGLAASCDEPEFRRLLKENARRFKGGPAAGDPLALVLRALILRALPRQTGPMQALALVLALPVLGLLREAERGDAPPANLDPLMTGSLLDTGTSLR